MKRKPRFQFRLSWLLATITLIAIGIAYPNLRLTYLIWRMDNTDLTNSGFGFTIEGPTKQIIDNYGLRARRLLKTKIEDPQRFAAAHVALTEVTGVKTGGTWVLGDGGFTCNGLYYYVDKNRLSFRLKHNDHLKEWWYETVGDNVGIPVVDEETFELCWPSAKEGAR